MVRTIPVVEPRKSNVWSSIVTSAAMFAGTVGGLATGSAIAFVIWQLA